MSRNHKKQPEKTRLPEPELVKKISTRFTGILEKSEGKMFMRDFGIAIFAGGFVIFITEGINQDWGTFAAGVASMIFGFCCIILSAYIFR